MRDGGPELAAQADGGPRGRDGGPELAARAAE